MRVAARPFATLVLLGFLATPLGAQPVGSGPPGPLLTPSTQRAVSFKVTDSFTAQSRPKVTVLTFENTNTKAQGQRYGASVEAMLVTYFKRKSQFVVVERQKIDAVLKEKKLVQTGQVQAVGEDPEARALLEKIDVFVLGTVTLLDFPSPQKKPASEPQETKDPAVPHLEPAKSKAIPTTDTTPPAKPARDFDLPNDAETSSTIPVDLNLSPLIGRAVPKEASEEREPLSGDRIEIDAKLISRFDGRIVAVAQRSGPVACLRSIVERLGIALEQEYLRPYYGNLTVSLSEPEHIRLFLTPILPEKALNEEKPPVELSTTVTIGDERDRVEPWTTDPSTYKVRNLLSGWYSMRIERPGYTPIETDAARWEIRKRAGQEVVYDRIAKVPLERVPQSLRRFVVRITPLKNDVLDLQSLQFTFHKEGGSFTPLVKRQYLDESFNRGPSRVLLMGGPKIELNRVDGPGEYADDPRCDLFEEVTPLLANYGRTYAAAGQRFDFDQFTGGELIIEDYKGEIVPTGRYAMVLWEPAYQIEATPITVRSNDRSSLRVSLTRETGALRVGTTGERPSSRALLQGIETGHPIPFPLDFPREKQLAAVPVDTYSASTDITDLKRWSYDVQVPASNLNPPFYDAASKKDEPRLLQAVPSMETKEAPFVGIKTRFGLAGRLRALSRTPDPLAADLFIQQDVDPILARLLYGKATRPQDEPKGPGPRDLLAQAGRDLLVQTMQQALAGAQQRVYRETGYQPPNLADQGSPLWALIPKVPQRKDSAGQIQPPANPRSAGGAQGVEPPAAEGSEINKAEPPPPDPFPKDPEALRQLLAERLAVVDLLVLDPPDMEKLRQFPEVARVIARWVSKGGSLFAFVASPGDYREVVGAPLNIEDLSRRTKRFDLAPGKIPGMVQITKKKVKSKSRRQLPELNDLDPVWRVLAFTKDGQRPRIIERGSRDRGGYVVVWFDDPEAFRGYWGGTRPEVERTRANVEEHVFRWSRDLMLARFGVSTQEPVRPTAGSKK